MRYQGHVACGPQLSRPAPCQWAHGHTHMCVCEAARLSVSALLPHVRSWKISPADSSSSWHVNPLSAPNFVWKTMRLQTPSWSGLCPVTPTQLQPNLQKLSNGYLPKLTPNLWSALALPHLQALNMLFLWHHLPLSSSQVRWLLVTQLKCLPTEGFLSLSEPSEGPCHELLFMKSLLAL